MLRLEFNFFEVFNWLDIFIEILNARCVWLSFYNNSAETLHIKCAMLASKGKIISFVPVYILPGGLFSSTDKKDGSWMSPSLVKFPLILIFKVCWSFGYVFVNNNSKLLCSSPHLGAPLFIAHLGVYTDFKLDTLIL